MRQVGSAHVEPGHHAPVRAFGATLGRVLACLVLAAADGGSAVAQAMSCAVSTGDGSVVVTMAVPHPGRALLYRPNGEVVYLDMEAGFEMRTEWRLTPATVGTVYRAGAAVREPALSGAGRYKLAFAENPETEPENTDYRECSFELPSVEARQPMVDIQVANAIALWPGHCQAT